MIVIRNASIELGPVASAETAERTVRRALEMLAVRAPLRRGNVSRLKLPPVEVPPGAGSWEVAETLAEALFKGIGASGAEERDA